jgi:hypothetical protein
MGVSIMVIFSLSIRATRDLPIFPDQIFYID